jgi:hypothetical protein
MGSRSLDKFCLPTGFIQLSSNNESMGRNLVSNVAQFNVTHQLLLLNCRTGSIEFAGCYGNLLLKTPNDWTGNGRRIAPRKCNAE